jgi:hypothetical protein
VKSFDEVKADVDHRHQPRGRGRVERARTRDVAERLVLLEDDVRRPEAGDCGLHRIGARAVVAADAQISVMYAKYHYLFWRPVSAIDPTSVSNDGFGPAGRFSGDAGVMLGTKVVRYGLQNGFGLGG